MAPARRAHPCLGGLIRPARGMEVRMPSRSRSFTVLDLLVVIGIIAVLLSILLPTLARVRAVAVSAQCLSNLRQIGQAAHMYANENKGQLPPDASFLSNLVRFIDWNTFSANPNPHR